MTPAPPQLLECPCCTAQLSDWFLGADIVDTSYHWSDGNGQDSLAEEIVPLRRCPECNAFFWRAEAKSLGELTEFPGPDSAKTIPYTRTPNPCEYVEALAVAWKWPRQVTVLLRQHLWWAQNDCERQIIRDLEQQARDSLTAARLKSMPALQRQHFVRKWEAEAKRLDQLRTKYPTMPEQDYLEQYLKKYSAISLGYFEEARRLHSLTCPSRNGPVFQENLEEFAALLDPERPEDRLLLGEIARELGDFKRAYRYVGCPSGFPVVLRRKAGALRDLVLRRETSLALLEVW